MIRRALNKDIDEILILLHEVLNIHYELRKDIFIKDSTKYTSDELKKIIQDDNRPIYVYEEDDKVLGYVFCVVKDIDNNNMVKHKELYIDDLCVLNKSRCKGVGRKLIEHVKKEAKTLGCYEVTLNVWTGNDAEKFYEALGFKTKKKELELILDENN